MSSIFFSSRRRHTRYIGDWSSDVCSSDLDVNALWDLAPHDIAIFNYLLDSSPEWVSAIGGKVQIGRASCRERVEISVGAGSWYEKTKNVSGFYADRYDSLSSIPTVDSDIC